MKVRRCQRGRLELGWGVGPWVHYRGVEVGVGAGTQQRVEAILYFDEEGTRRAVTFAGEAERARRFGVRFFCHADHALMLGRHWWHFDVGSRHLYLATGLPDPGPHPNRL